MAKMEIFSLTALLLAQFISKSNLVNGETATIVDYGESCDNNATICDPTASLKCSSQDSDGFCTCSNPEAMIYINSTNTCQKKVGESCSYQGHSTNRFNNWQDNHDCVPNTNCKWSGGSKRCECKPNFRNVDNGTCIPKSLFLETCQFSLQCRVDLGLHCVNDHCVCNKNLYLAYNYDTQKCASMAGFRSRDCVQNTRPNRYEDICQCDQPSAIQWQGICLKTMGTHCDPNSGHVCQRDMICVDCKCQCRFSGQRYQNGTCVSMAGQQCMVEVKNSFWDGYFVEDPGMHEMLKSEALNCTQNAECLPRQDNQNISECQCKPGYVQVNGECQLKFGAICGRPEDKNVSCDQSRNLKCIENQCKCPEYKLQYFDDEKEVCQGLVGASCQTFGYTGFCGTGAYCKEVKVNEVDGMGTAAVMGGKNGFCECLNGYKLTTDRKCEREFGSDDKILVDPIPLAENGKAFAFSNKMVMNRSENLWSGNWSQNAFSGGVGGGMGFWNGSGESIWNGSLFSNGSWGKMGFWNKSDWGEMGNGKNSRGFWNDTDKFWNSSLWNEFWNSVNWNEIENGTMSWDEFLNDMKLENIWNATLWKRFIEDTNWDKYWNTTLWNEFWNSVEWDAIENKTSELDSLWDWFGFNPLNNNTNLDNLLDDKSLFNGLDDFSDLLNITGDDVVLEGSTEFQDLYESTERSELNETTSANLPYDVSSVISNQVVTSVFSDLEISSVIPNPAMSSIIPNPEMSSIILNP